TAVDAISPLCILIFYHVGLLRLIVYQQKIAIPSTANSGPPPAYAFPAHPPDPAAQSAQLLRSGRRAPRINSPRTDRPPERPVPCQMAYPLVALAGTHRFHGGVS